MEAPSPEPKPKTIFIDANDWSTRAVMRIALLSLPLWAIISPILIYVSAGVLLTHRPEPFVDPFKLGEFPTLVWAPAFFLVGLISTALTTTNKIVLHGTKIFLPAFFFRTLELSQIKSITMHQKHTKYYLISFDLNNGEHLRISPGRLDNKRLGNLVAALRHRSPRCEFNISESDLERMKEVGFRFEMPKLATATSGGNRKKMEADGSMELEYRPHARYQQLIDAVVAHEKYFWRAWLSLILIPVLLMLPYVIQWQIMSMQDHTGDAPAWITAMWNIEAAVVGTAALGVGAAGGTYFALATNLYMIPIFVLLVGFCAWRFLKFLFQPNRLFISPAAIKLAFETPVTHTQGWRVLEQRIAWGEIKSVQLKKPRGSTSVDQWSINVVRQAGAPIRINLSALASENDRRALVQAIQTNAPQATCDAELIEALQPAQKRSYTELWLQSLATPPRRHRLAPLEAHQVLHDGRYTIDHRLGVGGQGVAYLATANLESGPGFTGSAAARLERGEADSGSDKVVLKEFIMPVYVDKNVRRQAVEKFEHEATILQRLDHPQVVKMMDYFIEDHRGYLVLEHIDGFSLQQMIENGKVFSEDEVIDLALQMCQILQYLHGLSPPVVHRDFTPDNLILNRAGVLKLIDFNVAQQRESTATGTVVGKHAYIPPEQFRGKPTSQSDFYAMGATLHFLLTGKDPEPLRQSNPLKQRSMSEALNSLIARCTCLDVGQRYQDPTAIVADLHALQHTLPGNGASKKNSRLLDDSDTSSATLLEQCPQDNGAAEENDTAGAGGPETNVSLRRGSGIAGPGEDEEDDTREVEPAKHVIYVRQTEEQHG